MSQQTEGRAPMDPLEPTVPQDERTGSARILIVGGDPEFRTSLVVRLNRTGHRCTHVHRLDEGRAALASQRYDLLLVTPELPDGDGLELARLAQRVSHGTTSIVFSECDSFAVALRAMRHGAVDYIRTPVELDDFATRIDAALDRSRLQRNRDARIQRLQRICKELNLARDEVTDQVDSLCHDLVTAYRDLTEQLEDATMATEFRTLLSQELDVEEVLRTMLEYMLSKTGPTNAAVFLPDPAGHFSLGAYVNYDCPRESVDALLDHLGNAICPQMAEETELVAFDDSDEFADWIGADGGFIGASQVIAFSCRADDGCLAVVVLFRSREQSFEPQLAGTLDILRTIFAEQLAQIIRVHHRAKPSWPAEAEDEFGDDLDFGLAA